METHLVEAGPGRKGAVRTAAPAMVVPDDATSVFMQARPGLFKIAHRIVGDTNEAEDVIQEAWLRWQRADRTVVRNPSALLRTTTARLAINLVQSAWKRRRPVPVPGCRSPRTSTPRRRRSRSGTTSPRKRSAC